MGVVRQQDASRVLEKVETTMRVSRWILTIPSGTGTEAPVCQWTCLSGDSVLPVDAALGLAYEL